MSKGKNRLERFIYNLIYSFMVFSLSYLCGLPIGVKLFLPLQILMVLLIDMAVKLTLIFPIILLILIAILTVGFVISALLFKSFFISILRRAVILFENIYYHITEMERIQPENTLLFWGIIILLLSIFTWFVVFKKKHPAILLPVYLGGILYYWYIYYDQAYWCMALFLFLFFLLVGLRNYSRERESTDKVFTHAFHYYYKSKISIIISYGLVIVALALALPKGGRIIRWEWLRDKAYEAFPFLEEFRSTEFVVKGDAKTTSRYINTILGYPNKPSKLGGPIVLSDKAVLNVYGEGPVYLRGNVRHTYTGTHWKTEDYDTVYHDLRKDFSGVPEEERKFYEEVTYSIINRTLTNIIFSPYKPSMVDLQSMYRLKSTSDDILAFSDNIDVGDRYTLTVLKPLKYDELIALGVDRKKEDINLSLYLQLPDTITDATRELVKEIVKDAKTDYEKAQAIERYLRENYRYTMDVESVPEGRDFVDYFLFESKEGYCTYFATAMAVMLRLEGIPARYVEGYLAHEAREENVYVVRDNDSHSWVEAFIEPVGWTTFEPTPAYPMPSDPESFVEPVEEKEEETAPQAQERTRLSETLFPGIEEEEEGSKAAERPRIEIKPKHVIIFILAVAVLSIPARFISRFIKVKYNDRKISRMPNKERLIYLYNEILKLIELRGITRRTGETHYEFVNRIGYNFSTMGDEKSLEDVTEIFVRNKYSNIITSDEDVLVMEDYKKKMEKRIKKFLGTRTYLFRRYFK